MYRNILEHVQRRYTDTPFVSETHYLINRFRPLIVNPQNRHKPDFYFTIIRNSSERKDIGREIVTKGGIWSVSLGKIFGLILVISKRIQ